MAYKLSIFSYNSRGFSANSAIVCNKLNSLHTDRIPIILNQENFILKGNSYKINQALPDSHMIIKPAEKNGQDSGRPKNGMFVSIPSAFNVERCLPTTFGVQAVLIKTESNILILNTYFPTDSHNFQSDDPELKEVLEVIRSVIKSGGTRHVIWGGDIIANF